VIQSNLSTVACLRTENGRYVCNVTPVSLEVKYFLKMLILAYELCVTQSKYGSNGSRSRDKRTLLRIQFCDLAFTIKKCSFVCTVRPSVFHHWLTSRCQEVILLVWMRFSGLCCSGEVTVESMDCPSGQKKIGRQWRSDRIKILKLFRI